MFLSQMCLREGVTVIFLRLHKAGTELESPSISLISHTPEKGTDSPVSGNILSLASDAYAEMVVSWWKTLSEGTPKLFCLYPWMR